MKKLLKHKWMQVGDKYHKKYYCQKCGTIRYWDFDYNHIMYQWGTKLTYRAPDCIGMNGKPYNP